MPDGERSQNTRCCICVTRIVLSAVHLCGKQAVLTEERSQGQAGTAQKFLKATNEKLNFELRGQATKKLNFELLFAEGIFCLPDCYPKI